MVCPICSSIYTDQIKYINCESFDDSFLYKNITVRKCESCGHIFNSLTKKELQNLVKYYKDEYAPSNLSKIDISGDLPGAINPANFRRYKCVLSIIEPYIRKNSKILDIGCAMGGFLSYLKLLGYKNLYGIEPIQAYVDEAKKDKDIVVKKGSVYYNPFEDNSFDIVILDQVLEHLSDLRLAMKQIKRVLRKGGLCYIGVPDVERYNDNIYWYLMREHIQHFSVVDLKRLAQLNGFELIKAFQNENSMIGTLKLQNLSVVLKVSSKVYCWGIGREFMHSYVNTRLKNLDLILIDDTPKKQQQTFKGKTIFPSSILKDAESDSFLIITSKVHRKYLEKKAIDLGYKGEIIDV